MKSEDNLKDIYEVDSPLNMTDNIKPKSYYTQFKKKK